MPQVVGILRIRRRRTGIHRQPGIGLIFRVLLGVISLVFLSGLLAIAIIQAQITGDLPSAQDMPEHFGPTGAEGYTPVRFYDRNGETILYEAYNPYATGARWLYVKENGLIDIQEHTLRAVLAAVDPDYFSRPRPNIVRMARDFFSTWIQGSQFSASTDIPQALAAAQLIPLGDNNLPNSINLARVQLMGQELDRGFSKFQLLEWFVNSADFGNDVYGLDAAAKVYLGKHASELSLAESALLAPIILQPSINPFSALEESIERQERVLDTMTAQRWISSSQALEAKNEKVTVRSDQDEVLAPLESILGHWLRERLGDQALNRSGLVVYTTIDNELQGQTECVMATQIERLKAGIGNETVAARAGETCLAASLLPPLRPRDQGVDHQIEDGAFIILDPQTGEILALAGEVNAVIPAGEMISPFIYLTAFSQGYSPGSMILDLPSEAAGVEQDKVSPGLLHEAHGPVRIRTALANAYPFATGQMMKVVGLEGVQRIAQNLDLNIVRFQADEQQTWQVPLFDLTYAYGVLAYQGQKVGARIQDSSGEVNGVELKPEILSEVENGDRQLIYRYQPESRAVVSPQLAYLLNDILRDEPARWLRFGTGNPLEVSRPTAAFAGMSEDGRVAWTVGYTPSIVVGVWMGNLSDVQPVQMEITNSAASVWHAIMQYVSRDLPAADWSAPPGVSVIEVCDPSGLLPTVYCPEVVQEVFSSGTEPITFDNLYQPYRVNTETGKLATLFTPPDQIEERVYLVPPPEAMAWAEATGIEQPPQEYDTLTGEAVVVEGVEIRSPDAFQFVRGEVTISGQALIDGFTNYRLQYGEGLNPTQWVQIGEERTSPVRSGRLGLWDTSTLNGLYTLQLIVVNEEGGLFTSAVSLTIDNQPPEVDVILPENGQELPASSTGVVLQVRADDEYGIASVSFYVDGDLIESISVPPYSTRWYGTEIGEHEFRVVVEDHAGNSIESSVAQFQITSP